MADPDRGGVASTVTEAQAIELITQAFVDRWTAAMPAVPFTLRNDALPSSDTFVLMTAMVTTGQLTTQGPRGTRRIERRGWVQIKTWAPAGGGARSSAQLADAARAVLELVTIPPAVAGDEAITTLASTTTDPTVDGQYENQVVRIPFVFAERK